MVEVILYTIGCPSCNVLKQKLDNKQICYQIQDSKEKMGELGITRLPVLSVDGTLLDFPKANAWVNEQ